MPGQGPSAVPGQSALSSAVPGQSALFLCSARTGGFAVPEQGSSTVLHHVGSPILGEGLYAVPGRGPSAVPGQGALYSVVPRQGALCAKTESLCCVPKNDRSAVPWQGSSCSNFIFYKILYRKLGA